VALVLLGAGLFVVEPLRHPLPAPTVELTVPASTRIAGTAPAFPWPAVGQAAVDVVDVGRVGASGMSPVAATGAPHGAVPIASVAKTMTAYVVLVGRPLQPGEEGPSLRVSAEQAAAFPAESARGESLVPVVAGATFTQRQALQALMLPSANNMARILAAWDAGSVAAFVAKMNATAAALGMDHTRYTDPSGLDAGTVSTAADQVILARRAMTLPVLAEIVAQSTATLPVAGPVANTNRLLGQDGVIGIKTGSTDEAGNCLMFAARATVAGRQVLIVGVVLGQRGGGTSVQRPVYQASRQLVRAVAAALGPHTVLRAGQPVAVVRGPLGTGTTLTTVDAVTVVGWPGMEVRFATDIPAVPARLRSGTLHGRVAVRVGEAEPAATPLRSTEPLAPPNTWSRLTHHA
jgi:D-alanyl-D-alanine carboxypeptidase (penicillin-binding protein 5/6)